MLADLRFHVQALSEKELNYWDRFPELELPDDKPRESKFTKSEYGIPRPVICLDDNQIYPSATEAAHKLRSGQDSCKNANISKD